MSTTNIGSLPPGAIILGAAGTTPGTGPLGPPAGVIGESSLSDGYRTKQGDTAVTFADTLTYSNGAVADLTGASVAFVMRNLSSATVVNLTGSGEVVSAEGGRVVYNPSASDTGVPGDYTTSWLVTFRGGATMTFPTIGFIDVTVEPAVASEPQLLVDLEAVKNYPGLSLPRGDRNIDARLEGFIQAARPLIEQITGPILPTVFDERYPGGNSTISLSHRPSVGYGTTPVLNVMAVSEYVGPTEYPLANVANASLGSIYSYEVNTRLGTITRRTAGGGESAFPGGDNSVHVVYQAGQSSVPPNVQEAVLELVRIHVQTTMSVGGGRRTQADATDAMDRPIGFFLPRSVREMLQPARRAPAIA